MSLERQTRSLAPRIIYGYDTELGYYAEARYSDNSLIAQANRQQSIRAALVELGRLVNGECLRLPYTWNGPEARDYTMHKRAEIAEARQLLISALEREAA